MNAGGERHRVVVVGAGFGGLQAVRNLRGEPAKVTLVDRRNCHLFQPLLDQVATGVIEHYNAIIETTDGLDWQED